MSFKTHYGTKIRKIKARCLCFLLISVFFATHSYAQRKGKYDPDRKFSAEQLRYDFELLRSAIEQFHPGAFLYTPKDSVLKYFDKYEASLTDSLTERQFRNQLMEVTEIIKCGHAGINSSDKRQQYFKRRPFKILPFELCFIDSQLFILKNFSKDSALKAGTRIISIENLPVSEIFNCMYAANASDGYNVTNRIYAFQHGVEFQYNRFYPEKDTFHLFVSGKHDSLFRVKCPAMLSDSFPFVKAKNRESIFTNSRNRFLLDERDSSVAILDLYAEEIFGYKRFYRKSFRYLEEHHIEKLVIDLRGNGGGFLLNPGELLSYLIDQPDHLLVWREKKYIPLKDHLVGRKFVGLTEFFFPLLRKVERDKSTKSRFAIKINFRPQTKWHFKGKVYVLIDGGTFSAASCIAAYLKKYKRATFIGQETGGAESGCNAFLTPFLILPETKIKYMLPLYRVENNVQPQKFGRGIFPDIETKYKLEDYLKNNDLEMIMLRNQ